MIWALDIRGPFKSSCNLVLGRFGYMIAFIHVWDFFYLNKTKGGFSFTMFFGDECVEVAGGSIVGGN